MTRTVAVLLLVFATASVHAVPSAPTGFSAVVLGSTVTLAWNAPAGVIVAYRLEAGTAPGLANLASILLGTTPSFVAPNVPAGAYYLRVRAVGLDGESASSNEVVVIVGGGGGCSTAPDPPSNFAANVNGSLVTFTWSAAGGCAATSYALQAGSAPSLTNLAILNVGHTFGFAALAPAGTYYLRALAQNAFGQSGPSNEAIVIVGALPPPPPPSASFGPGQYRVNIDIPPGRYYSDPAPGCYFERQSGLGGSFGEIIANEFIGFDARQWIVDIRSSDVGFETDPDCGRWYSTPRHGFQATIPQGLWASDAGFRTDDDCGVWSR